MEKLEAYKNEDFKLELRLEGEALPDEVFLVYNDRRFRMTSDEHSVFSYTFNKLQQNVNFNFLASGFQSEHHDLSLLNRPELLSFDVVANYPKYLGKTSEKLENVGNLIVPEGTTIQWLFNTQFADSVSILFDPNGLNEKNSTIQNHSNGYSYSKRLSKSSDYKIIMSNSETSNRENIAYYINVIPDLFPAIQLEQIKDTTLYNYIALGGNISDDYGLSNFKLWYKKKGSGSENEFSDVDIAINSNQLSQSFYHQFDLASLGLTQEDEIEYYLELWDNDGVNGSKSAKSTLMTFKMPSTQEYDQEVEKQVEDTENKMEELLKKSERT